MVLLPAHQRRFRSLAKIAVDNHAIIVHDNQHSLYIFDVLTLTALLQRALRAGLEAAVRSGFCGDGLGVGAAPGFPHMHDDPPAVPLFKRNGLDRIKLLKVQQVTFRFAGRFVGTDDPQRLRFVILYAVSAPGAIQLLADIEFPSVIIQYV